MSGGTGPELVRTPRFRPRAAWYVTERRDGLVHTTAWTTADRLVRACVALLEHVEGPVDVAIHDTRRGARWQGNLRSIADVRAAITELRRPLVHFGGVEVMVFTGHDQLTLTADLLLMIDARSERWAFLLDALGFEARRAAPAVDWHPSLAPAPKDTPLVAAVEALVRALALAPER